jgi:hypothetical protein
MVKHFLKILLLVTVPLMYGQTPSTTGSVIVSGYITDAITGEILPGATVIIQGAGKGTSTNAYGYYSITIKGEQILTAAFVGYSEKSIPITTNQKELRLPIQLHPLIQELSEIEISALDRNAQRQTPLMGIQKLDAATIKSMPVLFGETDPLKTLQLLPGIAATSEGASGFSVRGGNPDQNLLLLDEAIVYNGGHLLGFFSIFNNDAIKEVTVYKGDLPAKAGGRIASLIDIRTRDGNLSHWQGAGGIGLISSRLTLDGPLIENKSALLISGRRTYVDVFLPLSNDENLKQSQLYFYDLNLKANYILGENDRLFLSAYNGLDAFYNDDARMDFGNTTLTLRWNHLFSPKLFSNLSLVYSQYNYHLGSAGDETENINWRSHLTDYSIKYDFTYYPKAGDQINFGLQSIFHTIQPAHISSSDPASSLQEIKVPNAHSLEHGVYYEHTFQPAPRWTARYGFRLSLFQNVGKGQTFRFDDRFNITDTLQHGRGEIFNQYFGLEPRAGISWLATPHITLKSSYSQTRQYIHLASNSTTSTPLDVWFTSSPNIRPQVAHQFSVGATYLTNNNQWQHTLEIYYKKSLHAIDFKDHPNLLLNEALEAEIRPGTARSKGLEWMSQFTGIRITGWIAYTLSHSERKSQWINKGQPYLSPYDHLHDLTLVGSYRISDRLTIAGNWVYFTGSPVTLPVGRFDFQGGVVPFYSERNAERMPDYHRMDLSLTLREKRKPDKRWQGEWNFSVYNIYGRKNAWTINFVGDEDLDAYYKEAEKTYLFSIVPSVTYNINF